MGRQTEQVKRAVAQLRAAGLRRSEFTCRVHRHRWWDEELGRRVTEYGDAQVWLHVPKDKAWELVPAMLTEGLGATLNYYGHQYPSVIVSAKLKGSGRLEVWDGTRASQGLSCHVAALVGKDALDWLFIQEELMAEGQGVRGPLGSLPPHCAYQGCARIAQEEGGLCARHAQEWDEEESAKPGPLSGGELFSLFMETAVSLMTLDLIESLVSQARGAWAGSLLEEVLGPANLGSDRIIAQDLLVYARRVPMPREEKLCLK